MSRPRAGHGWAAGNLIATADGEWVHSSVARDWRRCERCRRPEQYPQSAPDGRVVCIHCYYYHCLPVGEFWLHKGRYLFPYNIGRRGITSSPPTVKSEQP